METSGTPEEDSAVQDFLRILEEHRRNCERQGKYVEAEIAKNRLEELRTHEEQRRKEALLNRQHAERVGVEEAHELEFQQVNALWDNKMEEYDDNADALVEQLKDKHMREVLALREQMQGERQAKPKFSRELLNFRRIEQTLAKQQDYAEAHKIKQKADNLELWELEKIKTEQNNRMSLRESQLLQRQDNEMRALEKRINSGREQQKKQRDHDIKRLLLRFKNLKSDLIAQQNIERQRLEKLLSAAHSRAASGSQGARRDSGGSRAPSTGGARLRKSKGKGKTKGKGKDKGKGRKKVTVDTSYHGGTTAYASPYSRGNDSARSQNSARDVERRLDNLLL